MLVRRRLLPHLTATVLAAAVFSMASVAAPSSAGSECPIGAGGHDHSKPHEVMCRMSAIASVKVSRAGGLGRIALHGKAGATLQRDEGIVALLDLSDPRDPEVVGRYDDGAQDSFDGDLAFSHDGNWLFYARQTHEFSKDGIHVLDVSDPAQPNLTHYEAEGGTFRIAYYTDGESEWVVSLDAIDGLVVHRFMRPAGVLVPTYVDPLPVLKVGGPASAGIVIDAKDPTTGSPLMYVTTGRTGLQVYDISSPDRPEQLGSWSEEGLADVDVVATKSGRTVFAATEYWFDRNNDPEIVVLDASDLGAIEQSRRIAIRAAKDPTAPTRWQVQGIEVVGRYLYAAHAHAGVLAFDLGRSAAPVAVAQRLGSPNPDAGVPGAPYAMDVQPRRGLLYATDASTGTLTVLRHRR